MFTRIDHVVVYVSDQKAALDFYVNKLGFELRHCSTGGIIYGGYHLSVGLKESPTLIQLALRLPGTEVQSTPIMLACNDLRKTHEELLARGVEFRCHSDSGLEFGVFYDPDKNEIYLSDHNPTWIDEKKLEQLLQGIPDT
jgi:catechol 2,3-dioxygenase-like lactoylglutathione lyase family enzyme